MSNDVHAMHHLALALLIGLAVPAHGRADDDHSGRRAPVSAHAQVHPPPRPETPEQIEACLGDLHCAGSWLLGKVDNLTVLPEATSGRRLANSWRSWHRYLKRIGRPAAGPSEAPAELVAASQRQQVEPLAQRITAPPVRELVPLTQEERARLNEPIYGPPPPGSTGGEADREAARGLADFFGLRSQ
jgi:hypothetical protein